MTKIIGLTGGIGSGKSTVAKLFEKEGIPVYIADDVSKSILDLPETVTKISQAFGDSILENSKINKRKLADIVFKNPEKLHQLNAIMHPLVKVHFDNWLAEHKMYPFIVKEAAILFESGSYKYCDKVITVIASEETRIARVMQRDTTTKEAVLDRIRNQWSDEMRIAKSDFVLKNENFESTMKDFQKILKKLKNL